MQNHLFDSLLENINTSAQFASLHDGRVYTYQDVLDVSARFANVLIQLGVQPGDRVAVQVSKSIEAVMLYLACVRSGAVFLPLNNAYTFSEVEYFLNDAKPSVFVCDPEKIPQFEGHCKSHSIALQFLGGESAKEDELLGASLIEKSLKVNNVFSNVKRGPDDLAAILYTSGTTGRSKGAMLSHNNLLSNAKVLSDYWQFSANDVLLHALPIFHTHGLFVAINVTLVSGSSMIFMPSFKVGTLIEHMPNASCLMGVPTFYTRLLNEASFDKAHCAHMRLFISGSAPLLSETHLQFEERTGHRILERYGMTETNMNTSNPYNGERRAGTVGFALPGVTLRIADPETGKPLPQGETGSIELIGDNVFTGYWEMPEKTAEEFRSDGFFITGDLGKLDADGYVHIIGRAKDLIISGGFNIYPKEIEVLLDDLASVNESAVIGIAHKDFGESVVAIVVPQQTDLVNDADRVAALENEIAASLSEGLAKFKRPQRIVVVSELPRNTMGKVQKNRLREHYRTLTL